MTHEEAVGYLQETGWLQDHDRQIYEQGKRDGIECVKAKTPCALCKWHLVEDDTPCWSCNARPIGEGAEE